MSSAPQLWCSISGHGFGHAAQVAPVLNALGRLIPDLRVVLRTTVPARFFHERLTIPWDHRPEQQDIGCVQDGPLKIDVPGTWAALETFHANWERRLSEEVTLLRSFRPNLVLSDISYFALDAAARAGIPTVALASLAWDEIMDKFHEPGHTRQAAIIAEMRRCYGSVDSFLRIAPSMPLRSFPPSVDVGPIVEPLVPDRETLRARIGATPNECVVLVGFGGISLTNLPYDQMESMDGYRFLIDGALPHPCRRIHSVQDTGMRFMTVLASTDIVMTKPGYSTIVECVDKRRPVIYVRRYIFGDEQSLVDYLHAHGHGIELSLADFDAGRWQASLDTLRPIAMHTGAVPSTSRQPLPAGTDAAAAHLAALLQAGRISA
ncbi:MAG: hypothetical protein U0172_04260 [Nitrospiraceae bacterium]